jgi:hypothetical protein
MENDPSHQLALVAQARSAAADRLVTPWWYHPILGLLVAAYVIVFSCGSTLWRAIGAVLFVASAALLARTYRAVTGVWIWGHDAGRASRWAYAAGAAIAAAMVTSWLIASSTTLIWPTWSLAALAWIAVILLGHRFDTAPRAQLRASA